MNIKNQLFIYLFIISNVAVSQTKEIIYKTITLNDGLTQSTVLCAHQDAQGYIWLGTYDGLNKFDGKANKRFTAQYNNSLTISNNSIYDICEDYNNKLYIATEGGGVNVFNPITESFHAITISSKPISIQSNIVVSILASSDSLIWILTQRGISIYNPKNETIISFPINSNKANALPNFELNTIFEDKNNNIWIGTIGGGLLKYEKKSNKFQVFYNEANGYDSYDNNVINSINEVNNNFLLIGSLKGAYLYNKKANKFSLYNNITNEITASLTDSEGTIWIGTASDGLYYKKKNQTIKLLQNNPYNLNSLAENHIRSLFEDNAKNIWIGFHGKGAAWFSLKQKEFYHIYQKLGENNLIDNNIFCLEEDNENNVWIGTLKGISIWNRTENTFNNFLSSAKNSISSNRIWEILYDKEKYIWIGGLNGVSRYDVSKKEFKNYRCVYNDSTSIPGDAVFAFEKDKNGNIWVGTYDGLARYNKNKDNFKRYVTDDKIKYLSYNLIWDILSDSKGRLWIATLNGLNQYIFESDSFIEIVIDSILDKNNNQEFTYLSEDSEGFLWISSRNGLIKYNPETNTSKIINTKKGLPSNTTLGVVEHKNHMWAVTSLGISKIDKKSFSIINYDIADGLQSSEFNIATVKLHDGLIMFGGINGITAFYPDSIHRQIHQPKIQFTNIELNGEKISPGIKRYNKAPLSKSILFTNTIELNYKEKLIHIGFIAIDLNSTSKIEYAYRVLPNTKEWILLGTKNSVTFTNLPPGKYTLEVKSTNSEQKFCNNTKSLELIIIPPYWKQKWFYSLEIILLIFLIYLFNILRNGNIKKVNLNLEKTVIERTEELSAQNEEIETQRNMANSQRDQITKQKKELEKFNDELEKKVKNRTKELEKAKLQAEESDRLKSSFLSNMSHEIRTPLNAIIGFSDVLLMANVTPEKKEEYIGHIKTNGSTLLSLLNDIIDISIIESGQLKFVYKKINIFSITNAVYISFKVSIEENNSNIKIEFKPDENTKFEFITDSLRLIQILNNLMSNALKYTNEGKITLSYKIINSSIHFVVKDTGIGIDKKALTKIFDRFLKIETSKSNIYRGGGLGLSICKNLVESLDGKIWVESELGVGSEFHFVIENQKETKLIDNT